MARATVLAAATGKGTLCLLPWMPALTSALQTGQSTWRFESHWSMHCERRLTRIDAVHGNTRPQQKSMATQRPHRGMEQVPAWEHPQAVAVAVLLQAHGAQHARAAPVRQQRLQVVAARHKRRPAGASIQPLPLAPHASHML